MSRRTLGFRHSKIYFLPYFRWIPIVFTIQVTEFQHLYPIQSMFSISNIASNGLIHVRIGRLLKRKGGVKTNVPVRQQEKNICKNQSIYSMCIKKQALPFSTMLGMAVEILLCQSSEQKITSLYFCLSSEFSELRLKRIAGLAPKKKYNPTLWNRKAASKNLAAAFYYGLTQKSYFFSLMALFNQKLVKSS